MCAHAVDLTGKHQPLIVRTVARQNVRYPLILDEDGEVIRRMSPNVEKRPLRNV
jgi:hypothetical protein